MKRKLMLSSLILIWIVAIAFLFKKKFEHQALEQYKKELRKAVLAYIEIEETFPEKLSDMETKVDLQKYSLSYEIISDGTGCRVKLNGQESFELWLGK